MEDKTYFGCKVKQRADANTTPFFVFHARVKDIVRWAGIRRVQDLPRGTQRLLRKTRTKAITRFIRSFPINTIPNNILLAFQPEGAEFTSLSGVIEPCLPEVTIHNGCDDLLDWGTLKFSFDPEAAEDQRPALIVDGQHRLFGMSEFDQEDLPVLVVCLIEAPLQEQAFQFVVINNKVVKVPTDNVKTIIAEVDEEALQDRLLKAGVAYGQASPILREINDLGSSPFQNLLDWDYNRLGPHLVPLTAIEQALRHLKAMFTFLGDDDDSLVELFSGIWRAVKAQYPTLWGNDNTFMKKVNINALNEFLAERTKMAWEFNLVDIFNIESVEPAVLRALEPIPASFWETQWTIVIQDNANVRKMIKDDLEKMTQNNKLGRPWNDDLQLPVSAE